MKVIEENNHSPFLTFTRKDDVFAAESSTGPGLSFLRLEMVRIRPGMSDYLVRIASPKIGPNGKNTIITIRGNRTLATPRGAMGTARVIAREMKKRGDQTFAWDKVNIEHLSRMIQAPLKFFSQNVNCESLNVTTEALT